MKPFLGKAYVLRGLMFRGAAAQPGQVLALKESEMMLLAESGRAEAFDPSNPVHAAALAKAAKQPAKAEDETEEDRPKKK